MVKAVNEEGVFREIEQVLGISEKIDEAHFVIVVDAKIWVYDNY